MGVGCQRKPELDIAKTVEINFIHHAVATREDTLQYRPGFNSEYEQIKEGFITKKRVGIGRC